MRNMRFCEIGMSVILLFLARPKRLLRCLAASAPFGCLPLLVRRAMIKQPTLLSFVVARSEYVRLNVVAGMQEGSTSFLNMSNATKVSIIAHVKAMKTIPQHEATQILEQLLKMPMVEADRQGIISAVNEKVWLAYPEPAADVTADKKQHIERPELFLTLHDWELMQNQSTSVLERVTTLAARFTNAGLRYPTENTTKAIVALALTDRGDPMGLVDTALQSIATFKSHIKMARSDRSCNGTLPTFGGGPASLKAEHPLWYEASYGQGAPAATLPLDPAYLRAFTNTLGCRKTKHGAAMIPSRPPIGLNPMVLASMLQQHGGVHVDGLPGFRWCSPPEPAAPLHGALQKLHPPAIAASPAFQQYMPALQDAPSPRASDAASPSPLASLTDLASTAAASPAPIPTSATLAGAGDERALEASPENGQVSAGPTDMIADFKEMLKTKTTHPNVKTTPTNTKTAPMKRPAAKIACEPLKKRPAASPATTATDLGKGWRKEYRTRTSGSSVGNIDVYYIHIKTAKVCRSMVEVKRYDETIMS